MKVDQVILRGMMENYHKLATGGERLAALLLDNSIPPDLAYDTTRTLASFGGYMLDALEQVGAWGYAEFMQRQEKVLRGNR
jgi:hypothetical protein